ncbi:hypothetical protein BgiBS90_001715 [Biomphalaria glabrata]|nr:hypothetical protein BgiBS90_001715 [Biomphalaria glabrata]
MCNTFVSEIRDLPEDFRNVQYLQSEIRDLPEDFRNVQYLRERDSRSTRRFQKCAIPSERESRSTRRFQKCAIPSERGSARSVRSDAQNQQYKYITHKENTNWSGQARPWGNVNRNPNKDFDRTGMWRKKKETAESESKESVEENPEGRQERWSRENWLPCNELSQH